MHKGMTFSCVIEGNILRSPGVDFGSRLEIMHRKDGKSGKHLVLRCKGSMGWSGVGSPFVYSPTHYMLVTLTRQQYPIGPGSRMVATVVQNEEPGVKWRPALATLIRRCDKLA